MAKKADRKREFRSEAAAAAHEMAADLYEMGSIDKLTMRKLDLLCRTRVEPMSPREILALREKAGVSQGVFASVLNVRPGLVSQWERGRAPSLRTERCMKGRRLRLRVPSLKLLSLIKAKGFEAVI